MRGNSERRRGHAQLIPHETEYSSRAIFQSTGHSEVLFVQKITSLLSFEALRHGNNVIPGLRVELSIEILKKGSTSANNAAIYKGLVPSWATNSVNTSMSVSKHRYLQWFGPSTFS